MKTFITIFFIIILAGTAWVELTLVFNSKEQQDIRTLRFQHTRDSLIIDSLRNPVDTTEFLTEHSEIRK